ncbi:hypothetical protein KFE25_008334 [Diacronema lutheri]|uniref:Uncharacterized protein n=1 Tax=Diacronema lutheri TaxID=2081491 RepID=A0A8J6CEI6_DIALT|nr:hypothetical protein KFE25_008334 [Diacronema lutheri]
MAEVRREVERACATGDAERVRAMLCRSADVRAFDSAEGWSALMHASFHGHVDCVRALVRAGAAHAGPSALMLASQEGHIECARELLEAGADANYATAFGHTALMSAIHRCPEHARLPAVQLLCAYGARRESLFGRHGPELHGLPADCASWLCATRRWCSALHHVELLPAARVRALILAGADVHASDGGEDAPTPLVLACALLARSATGHEGAQLVLDAAAPWSPRTASLFPAHARTRARAVLLLGHQLARAAYFAGQERAFVDVWLQHVMAHAISRACV